MKPRAFTLIEMLAVVAVIAILIGIAVPAFRSLQSNANAATAETLLQSAVSAARNAAVRDRAGNDAAAVFTFEPGGNVTVIVCTQLGQIDDGPATMTAGVATPGVVRDVFAPLESVRAIQLPKGWSVRAFAAPGLIDDKWYEPFGSGENRYRAGESAWVFPESGLYPHEVSRALTGDVGTFRQSFMVRFEGGTGRLVTFTPEASLVVLARSSGLGRTQDEPFKSNRLDTLSTLDASGAMVQAGNGDVATTVEGILTRSFLFDPTLATQPVLIYRRLLIGDRAGDSVLCRPVDQLALYKERELCAAFGIEPDRLSGTAYFAPTSAWPLQANPFDGPGVSETVLYPRYVASLRQTDRIDNRINRWVEGYLDLQSTTDTRRVDVPPARRFTVDRRGGHLRAFNYTPPSQGGGQ